MARILREKTGAPLIFTYHTKYDIDIERAVKIKSLAKEGINLGREITMEGLVEELCRLSLNR